MQPIHSLNRNKNNSWKTVRKKSNGINLAKVTPDAVIVRITVDKTYADTLKGVKKGLNDVGLIDEVGVSRRTMKGDLLLHLKKRTNKTLQLRAIVEDTTGAETYLKASTVIVEIRGLDIDATPDDLATAISARVKASDAVSAQSVKAIKPGYGNKSTAVVLLPAKAANELARRPQLGIGWVSCTNAIP